MPGIYTRDQFAQQLANAIEKAQARREAYVNREAARTDSNVKALSNFGKAVGRAYETSPSVLAKRRQELLDEIESIKAAQVHENSGPTQAESYSNAMAGYEPNRLLHIPGYADTTLGLLDDRDELESRLDNNFNSKYRPKRGLY